MVYIVWQKIYSVGVPSIDQQHEKLVGIINTLYDRIRVGKGSEGIIKILEELSAYAETHFRHEELLMGEVGYSGLKDQEKSHNAYRTRVAEMEKSFRQQPMQVLEFLKEWWLTHITKSDMLYKDALRGKA
jgi:hemerythrin